jgi:hypothetical protein
LDKIFDDFKIWIKDKDDEWKKKDVTIDEIVESTHAHQIHINLSSEIGYGHIGLYESNSIYWIEFEAVERNFENFYKHIEFDRLPDFHDVEMQYIKFLTSNK